MKCKHCKEEVGIEDVEVCDECWKKHLEEERLEYERRRPNYHTVESCATCRHCFVWWDPETWDGTCDIEGDIPVTTKEEHRKLLRGRRKEHKEGYDNLADWIMANGVNKNAKCDKYESGVPRHECDSEPKSKPRKRKSKAGE